MPLTFSFISLPPPPFFLLFSTLFPFLSSPFLSPYLLDGLIQDTLSEQITSNNKNDNLLGDIHS